MSLFTATVAKISPLDEKVMREIREHQNNLTKPPGMALKIVKEMATFESAGVSNKK
jgi:hypothetical protein